MIRGRLYRQDNHQLLLPDVMLTTTPLERMRGLLGRPPLQPQQGLLITPCAAVHTIGMRYPIDLIFLGRDWRVRKLVQALPPFRFASAWGAYQVIELPGGSLNQLELTPETPLYWENDTCV